MPPFLFLKKKMRHEKSALQLDFPYVVDKSVFLDEFVEEDMNKLLISSEPIEFHSISVKSDSQE